MGGSYLRVQTTKAIWISPTAITDFELKDTVVWRIHIPALLPQLAYLQTLLNLQETEKIKRYRQETDQQSRIISRSVLRILLGKYLAIAPAEINFQPDKNNKLTLQNTTSKNLHFNVSHSGNWVLIAISTNQVGVDVEKIDASFSYQNLLDFSFSLEEKLHIQSNQNPQQSFYKLWTRKEALLKATGKGLVVDLTLIPSLDGLHQNPEHIIASDKSWQIISFDVDKNHLGSAVFMPVKTALQFFNFQL